MECVSGECPPGVCTVRTVSAQSAVQKRSKRRHAARVSVSATVSFWFRYPVFRTCIRWAFNAPVQCVSSKEINSPSHASAQGQVLEDRDVWSGASTWEMLASENPCGKCWCMLERPVVAVRQTAGRSWQQGQQGVVRTHVVAAYEGATPALSLPSSSSPSSLSLPPCRSPSSASSARRSSLLLPSLSFSPFAFFTS